MSDKGIKSQGDWFQLSPQLLCVCGFDGHILEFNPAWNAELGWSEAELKTATLLELVWPEDRETTAARVGDCQQRGGAIEFESRHIHKSGGFRWFRWHLRADLGSRTTIGIANNITAHREVELQFKDQKDLLDVILQSVPLGINVKEVGERNRWVLWSRGMEELVRVNASEALGKTNDEIYPPDTARNINKLDKLCLEQGTVLEETHVPSTVEGRGARIFRTRKVPLLRGPDGKFKYLLSVVDDITELRMAQKQLVYNANVSSLASLAGGIAHEINSPLGIISGKMRQLRAELEEPAPDHVKLDRDLYIVDATVQRIARILKGLLYFAHGEDQEALVEATVASIIATSIELCRDRFHRHRVELRIHCDPELALICRPAQLSQVLYHLLVNAHDAVLNLTEKWVRLDVVLRQAQVLIAVIDSGRGIDPDIADMVMLPFFTTKPIGQGIGLGLSISKGIAESHNGELRYDAQSPNTKFLLTLPTGTPPS